MRTNLCGVPLLPVTIGPIPGLKPALDADLLTLREVLFERLGQTVPNHDTVPVGPFLPLLGLVGPVLTGSQAEVAHRGAGSRAAKLGITAKVPDQKDLVDTTHGVPIQVADARISRETGRDRSRGRKEPAGEMMTEIPRGWHARPWKRKS